MEHNGHDAETGTTPAEVRVPGYQIEKTLGAGAMASVYLATQESLSRKVALKIIAGRLSGDSASRARFLREARVVAQLNHPNIVTVHDSGVHDNRHYYMAMELVNGGTLLDRIKSGLTPAAATAIVRQVATALSYAHRRGFVHRDIKPGNILLRDDGSVVVSDFGIASTVAEETLTPAGYAVGSPRYMSPEQAHGAPVDGRSDLYSLGIVFCEMLTGSLPRRTPAGADLQLPDHLAAYRPVLARLLAFRPEDRFADAEELIRALDSLPADPPAGRRPRPWLRRGGLALAAAAAGLALLGGAAWTCLLPYPLFDRCRPLAVEYFYRPGGEGLMQPFTDGSVLRSGDHYKVRFTPRRDGYAYVFQIDSSGRIFRLFPPEAAGAGGNPVQGGAAYILPAADQAYELDDQAGEERIRVVFYDARNSALEDRYEALEAARQRDAGEIATLGAGLLQVLDADAALADATVTFMHRQRGD